MPFSEAVGMPDNLGLPVASPDSRLGTGDKRMLGSDDLTGGAVVVSEAPEAVDSGAGDEGWLWGGTIGDFFAFLCFLTVQTVNDLWFCSFVLLFLFFLFN